MWFKKNNINQVFAKGVGGGGSGDGGDRGDECNANINAAFSKGMRELQNVAFICTDPNFVSRSVLW